MINKLPWAITSAEKNELKKSRQANNDNAGKYFELFFMVVNKRLYLGDANFYNIQVLTWGL